MSVCVCERERAKTCVCVCVGGVGLEGSVRCPGIHFMCVCVYVRVCEYIACIHVHVCV